MPAVGSATAKAIARKFGLTRSEARLVFALIDTGSLRAAAAICSIKVETGRQYLKSIFRKTGTANQVGLVVFLMNIVQAGLE